MFILILFIIIYLALQFSESDEIGFFGWFFMLAFLVINFFINLIKFIIALIKVMFFGGGAKNGN